MRMINNGEQLLVSNVCMNCLDGNRDTDLMVIQCNASNVHGYVFTDVYLNVLGECNISLYINQLISSSCISVHAVVR